MDGDLRVSDAERAAALARLGKHHAAGRLSADDLSERSALARSAVTRSDLRALFQDMPRRLTGRQRHAVVFVVVVGAVLGLWQATRDPHPRPADYGADYWWPLWFALVWGVVLLLHAIVPPPKPQPSPVEDVEDVAHPDLTAREREVLALVAEGAANKEIARRLFISERTARTHVSNILHKLGLTSRTQAALAAREQARVQ
jgi:DNA-binding CsgD family transcriptional regulator